MQALLRTRAKTVARIALLPALVAWIAAGPAAAQPLFPGPRFPTDGAPGSVDAGDMDGDGVVDLVSTTTGYDDENGVRLLLGNGDGTFQAPLAVAGAGFAVDAEIADLDGNGALDVAFTDAGVDSVRILLGVGDGTFVEGTALAAGAQPWRLDVADVNGDGRADVLTHNDGGRVFLGNGDGTFQAPLPLSLSAITSSAEAHDVDGDGRPDLVSLDYDAGTMEVRLGDGDGTFGAAQVFDGGFTSGLIPVVADMDGDGKADAIVPRVGDGVELLRGNGDGSFQAPTSVLAEPGAWAATVADMDGDGALDVIAVGQEPVAGERPVAWVVLGNGDGTFQPATVHAVAKFPVGLAVADLDGDRVPDLAGAGREGRGISVLTGRGDGTLLSPTFVGGGFNPEASSQDDALAALDLDGDGHVDLVTLDAVLLGDGDGGFPTTLPIASGDAPIDFVLAQVDGDGLLDLLVQNRSEDVTRVLLGNGDGTFTPVASVPVGGYPRGLAAGDLDGDGDADLVTVEQGYRRNRMALLLGDGVGGFGTPSLIPLEGEPDDVGVGDFDGDGLNDVAVIENRPSQLGFWPGNGDGTLRAPTVFPLGGGSVSLRVADVDGDGALDVLTTETSSRSAIVLYGNGDGTFVAAAFPDLDGPGVGSPLIAADVDGDDVLDLVARGPEYRDVSLMLGNGDRTFGAPAHFIAHDQSDALAAADLDEDGFVDLVGIERSFDQRLVIWRNQSETARVCDADGDGRVDRRDVQLIRRARGEDAEPRDPRDADGDGRITRRDARDCAEACDRRGCRVVVSPGCGLLGIEPLALLPWLRRRRRGLR